jgi:hypothetical protein
LGYKISLVKIIFVLPFPTGQLPVWAGSQALAVMLAKGNINTWTTISLLCQNGVREYMLFDKSNPIRFHCVGFFTTDICYVSSASVKHLGILYG